MMVPPIMASGPREHLDTDEQVVRGTIQRVTFRNAENGYSVVQMQPTGSYEMLTVVGIFPDARGGAQVVVRGSYISHPKFGRQLQASSIIEATPSTAAGIETYLASGLIKGIGEKTAARLVEAFGEEAINVIISDPNKAAKIPGVGKKKAVLLAQTLEQQKDTREILRFLIEHNLSPNMAQKIYEKYRNRSLEVLKSDPYILARDMRGVGFITADQIALKLGIQPDSPQRLRAGLIYSLERAADDGHCFLYLEELLTKVGPLLGLEQSVDLLSHVDHLVEHELVTREEDRLSLPHLARAERFVGSFITGRNERGSKSSSLSPEAVDTQIKIAETALSITLSPEQREAVQAALTEKVLIITGGPGCGKTTVIRAVCAVLRTAGKVIKLAAPTGRAAQRMAQVTSVSASTIHRLLKFEPQSGRFQFGPNEPLPCDALIIDEASMIDISLAKDLLSALPLSATLILVGDKDQLPSVGPGRVFADLIASASVKTIALSRLFRRGEDSAITQTAHLINAGIVPEIPSPDGVTKTDCYIIPKNDQEEAAQMIEKLVSDQLPKKFGFALSDIVVLTPSNRGPLGTIALNERLQKAINPFQNPETELAVGQTILRLGDRVCQRVNNYNLDEIGVYNGDTGFVFEVAAADRQMHIELWDGRLIKYTSSQLHELSLAYAMTVHRSQGSEIPCVVLALHESHFTLLERQLLYTAITRAKKLLVIVGSKKALSMAVKRTSSGKRRTWLKERICKESAGGAHLQFVPESEPIPEDEAP